MTCCVSLHLIKTNACNWAEQFGRQYLRLLQDLNKLSKILANVFVNLVKFFIKILKDPGQDFFHLFVRIFKDFQNSCQDLQSSCQDLEGSLRIFKVLAKIFEDLAKVFKDLERAEDLSKIFKDLNKNFEDL